MNAAPAENANKVGETKKENFFGWFLLICLLWTFAISNKSLWLDEAHGAGWKAKQTTLAEFWNDDIAQKGSNDSQIPLYVFYIWVYAKFFGSNEWVLRAANLPIVFLGFWIWWKAFPKRSSVKFCIAAVAVTSPFLWYYLNEARPYAMQIGSSFLIVGALQQLYKNSSTMESRWPMAAFCLGLVLLSGSNLLGQLWAAGAIATAVFIFGWQKTKSFARNNFLLCLSTAVVLLAFGFYYLWTLKSGSRSTLVGKTDAKNFLFIAYELLGFSGLGPGRLDIRSNGLNSFRPFAGFILAYAIFLTPLLFAGAQQTFRLVPKRIVGFTILFFGGVTIFLGAVGIVTNFRILGRHFAPLLVFIICLLGFGINRLWFSNRLGKIWIICFVALSFASSLSLRFAPRHDKDDYRGAAAIARDALQNKKIVWWNADGRGAGFYGVATSTNDVLNGARVFMNPTAKELEKLRAPDVVIASKPDVYDSAGAVSDFLREQHFEKTTNLNAFTVWQRSGEK